MARLAPLLARRADRAPGLLKGQITIADDFDALTADDERDWYGD